MSTPLPPRLFQCLCALALAPLLLAPVRFQSGNETITLAPSAAPSPSATQLPSAGPLSSPTVITVSPTFLLPTPTAVATPSLAPVAGQTGLMPEVSALICNQAQQMLAEMAMLSYQQKRTQPTMNLMLAGAAGAAQAGQRQYPTVMGKISENAANMAYNTPQRKELSAAVGAVQTACRNPNRTGLAPGSRVPMPRPE